MSKTIWSETTRLFDAVRELKPTQFGESEASRREVYVKVYEAQAALLDLFDRWAWIRRVETPETLRPDQPRPGDQEVPPKPTDAECMLAMTKTALENIEASGPDYSHIQAAADISLLSVLAKKLVLTERGADPSTSSERPGVVWGPTREERMEAAVGRTVASRQEGCEPPHAGPCSAPAYDARYHGRGKRSHLVGEGDA